jgi:uncharacterized protein with PQ loop repeat
MKASNVKLSRLFEDIYDKINNEEDARICKDIDDNACRYTPANYFIILISNTLTKIGDTLSNPKTVLAWLMNFVGAPVYLISFIVPIRESGSMLPQLIISKFVREREYRKWIWVAGSVIQFLAITGIGVIALKFQGQLAGWLIIASLVVFSLARSLSSVASKDVLGKTIPKTKRGKLSGLMSSISGIFTLLAGVYLIYRSSNGEDISFYSTLIFFAGATWLVAAMIYANVKEFPGETAGGRNGLREAFQKLSILKTDKQFRNFVVSRALLLCSALTAPFYILLAQNNIGKDSYLLGIFIIVNGVASIVSAPFWGKMADLSSKGVMMRAGLMAAVLGISMYGIITLIPSLKDAIWLYPLAFFLLGIAHSGVRLGRKTYVVDLAVGNKRTDYVAVSNTIIGLILLVTGGISALVSLISIESIILALSTLGLAGAYVSYRLPRVE